ncbi:hypothetical protein [Nocardia sienata]|uniref:hypothetical protein n=1 Tax=Nocardia sienata TaxID=248552 RepID=UPI0007A541C9|nr:hypothetical protein [Nocardia sienata]
MDLHRSSTHAPPPPPSGPRPASAGRVLTAAPGGATAGLVVVAVLVVVLTLRPGGDRAPTAATPAPQVIVDISWPHHTGQEISTSGGRRPRCDPGIPVAEAHPHRPTALRPA